jgi:hypothetical protein
MTCRSPRWPSSAGQLWPPGSLRHSPVDPLEQHRQLGPAQHRHPFLSPRPDESATLQTLGKQTQPVAIPPQQLDQIAAGPRKQNTWPENGSCPSTVCACAARLSKPLRMFALPRADGLPPLDIALAELPTAVNPLGVKGAARPAAWRRHRR